MAESSSVDDSAREYSSIEEAARADADANYTEASSASSMPAFENPIDAMRYHDAWVDRMAENKEPGMMMPPRPTSTTPSTLPAQRHWDSLLQRQALSHEEA
jgi:hypothetical protein